MSRPLAALLTRAHRATDDVTELEDEFGNRATILRDPTFPGAFGIQVWRPGEAAPAVEQWEVPATEQRPPLFPEGVRFVPGLGCSLMVTPTSRQTSWKSDGPLRASIPPALEEALQAKAAEARQGSLPGGEVSVMSLARDLGDPAAVAWVESIHRETEPAPEMVAIFEELVAELAEDGWTASDGTPASPRVAREVHLARGAAKRLLILSSMGGMDSLSSVEFVGSADDRLDAEGTEGGGR